MQRVPEREYMDDPAEARAYADADFSAVNEQFVEDLCKFAGEGRDLRCVDLGCGPADIPIRLAKARPTWEITAVDAAPAMLSIASNAVRQAGVADRVRLICVDAGRTGLPTEDFDGVLSNSILHHMPDPLRLWREIKRIVAPGGWVFLRDLARPVNAAEARRLVEQHSGDESELLKEEFHRSLLSAFTPAEIRDQLQAIGLTTLTVRTVSDRHLDVTGRL
ncbi:MAG: class I SAM-dependent methyltransferase [Phycisphaerae bacterium]